MDLDTKISALTEDQIFIVSKYDTLGNKTFFQVFFQKTDNTYKLVYLDENGHQHTEFFISSKDVSDKLESIKATNRPAVFNTLL